jgi:hypothetical protein
MAAPLIEKQWAAGEVPMEILMNRSDGGNYVV